MQHLQGAKHTRSHEAPCPHAEVGDELGGTRSKRAQKSIELSFPFPEDRAERGEDLVLQPD